MEHWARMVLEDAVGPLESIEVGRREDLMRIAALVADREVVAFRTADRDGLAEALTECTSLDGLTQLMQEAAQACGFQYGTIYLLRQGSGGVFRTRISTSYPLDWVLRYQEKSYRFVDPVMRASETRDGPFLFSEIESAAPVVHAFWEDAARYGVGREGFAVAFDFEKGVRVGVTFSTVFSKERFSETFPFDAHDALKFARLGAEVFILLARRTFPPPETLNRSELRFLHLLLTSDGPEEAISELVLEGTMDVMQASICTKLRVWSVIQAVAVATANHWFDDLAFDVRDVSVLRP